MRLTILIAALALSASIAATHAGASEGAIEYREHTMEAVGGHMEAMVDILRQKVAHTSHMGLHANAVADLADIADTLFPPGSEGGDALPEIWSDPEDFAERLASFKEAAHGLQSAVSAGEPIGPAFQNLGQACKDCHDNYRAE